MITTIIIVDDSATARLALRRALERDPEVQVVGEAADRKTALTLVESLRPSIVTMDVYLESDNGIEVTAALMTRSPVPILIVTSRDPSDPRLVYQAMEAGALDVFGKLPGEKNIAYEVQQQRLVRLVKALSRVPVVRRRRAITPLREDTEERPRRSRTVAVPASCRAILIGASTGGPPVLAELLRGIKPPSPRPIVIVQHMAVGFNEGFAAWLKVATGHEVVIVEEPRALRPGVVYLAPVGRHLVFAAEEVLGLVDDPPRVYQKPSVDVLFESAAKLVGSRAVAVLLTGMGRDGAAGLLALRRSGAYTMVQELGTCVVAGMPGSALELGAAAAALPPLEIARRLVEILGVV